MEIQDVQLRKVKGSGVCIYCGRDGDEYKLSSEHTMPYSLGGSTELLGASCEICGAETSYIDGYLARRVFNDLRVHLDLQSRSGHPKALRAEIGSPNGQRFVNLPPRDHPYFLNMPIWDPPALLLEGGNISGGFENPRTDVYWFVPENIRQTLNLSEQDKLEVINNIRPHNFRTFARAITKVAYCTAILKFGLCGFRPLFTPQIILGNYPNIPYLVGPFPGPHGAPAPTGQQHTVEFGTLSLGRLKLIFANVRLFADSSAPQGGMPRYQVILGREGERKIFPRRDLPQSRTPILL